MCPRRSRWAPPAPAPPGGARTSSARPTSTFGGCTPAPRTRTSSSSASREWGRDPPGGDGTPLPPAQGPPAGGLRALPGTDPPSSPPRYGKIVSTKAILDKTTNKCKGWGGCRAGVGGLGGLWDPLSLLPPPPPRLRLRRLRQPHGGPEGRDGAQGQRGAGADGQGTARPLGAPPPLRPPPQDPRRVRRGPAAPLTPPTAAGAGPHQPLHLQPAAGGGRAGAGGAAEALRAGGLDPHPAGPPRGQPRRGLRTVRGGGGVCCGLGGCKGAHGAGGVQGAGGTWVTNGAGGRPGGWGVGWVFGAAQSSGGGRGCVGPGGGPRVWPPPQPRPPPGWSPRRSARLSSPTSTGSTSRCPRGCQVGWGGSGGGSGVGGGRGPADGADGPFPTAPPDPLLCKFADGGQKKRQSQSKFVPNGRSWARDGDAVRGGLGGVGRGSCRGGRANPMAAGGGAAQGSADPFSPLRAL